MTTKTRTGKSKMQEFDVNNRYHNYHMHRLNNFTSSFEAQESLGKQLLVGAKRQQKGMSPNICKFIT